MDWTGLSKVLAGYISCNGLHWINWIRVGLNCDLLALEINEVFIM